MKNSTKGFVAGAAGIGLLLGASTFALWSDSRDVNGGEIASGNLAVEVSDPTWQDVSVPGAETDINLENFQIVPGDKLQGTYNVKVDLAGTNMAAHLRLVGNELEGELADGLAVDYQIHSPSGDVVASGDEAGVQIELDPGSIPNGVATDDYANFHVVAAVDFAENADLALTETTAVLADAQLELQQVRGGTDN